MTTSLAWGLLLLAGLLDVLWAGSMKLADGLARPGWTLVSVALLAGLVLCLGRALTVLPVGTAYAVWTGVGAVGTVLLGIVFFEESAGLARLGCIGLVVAGVVGLKLLPT